MNKTIEKILNNALVLLVIMNLVSYQMILPISISRAEDTGGETTESVSDSDSSDSGSSDSSDSSEEADEEEESEEASPEKAADEENTTEPETEEAIAPEVASSATSEVPADSSEAPVAIQQEVASSATEGDVAENSDSCACQNDVEENNNEEKTCPSDCVCCQSHVTQTNVAEEVNSTTTADSVTGENEITGEVDPALANETLASVEEGNVQSTDGNNNEGESDNDDEDDATNSAGENQSVIVTGDAVAQTQAVNEINTNIYTENGTEYVRNITGDFTGDINLIEAFDDVVDGAQKLNEENEKAFESVVVTNVNVAKDIKTTVLADANSGDNLVEALDGVAEIVTGGAEALASAVNFINTNIVGDNWILAKINNFGNWTGDLIVPGEGLFDLPAAGMIFDQITSTNLAKNVASFISSDANSGDNSVSDVTGDVTVSTGDAVATGNGVNVVNTNIVKNNWFFLLINNAGDWTGQVFNWNNGNQELAYEYNFGSLEGVDAPVTKSVSVNNYNSAENIESTVLASADSGGNVISGVKGDATIMTGDAIARASAFNFINTNIVGNNWFMAVVNNAGTWNGDLIFGYPDLAVNLSADKKVLEPGKGMTYTVRYKNIGQAKCGNVDLILSLPGNFFYQSDSLGGMRKSGNDYFWNMAGLKPGEEKTFTVNVLLDPATKSDVAELESVAGVKTGTEEVNLANNYATDAISVTFSQVTIQEGLPEKNGRLSITRQEDTSVAVGSISTHTIFVKNSGKETLYNLEVKEGIKNPSGEKMVEYIWPIEKLKKGQTATIQYQIFAGSELALGDYRHTALARAIDQFGREVESEKATQMVTFFRSVPAENLVSGSEDGDVLTSPEVVLAPEEVNSMPEILGVTNEKNFAWQWLLLLVLIPMAYYARRERVYRWETIQKFSRQMGSFLSTFL